jgi:hypothetical protein
VVLKISCEGRLICCVPELQIFRKNCSHNDAFSDPKRWLDDRGCTVQAAAKKLKGSWEQRHEVSLPRGARLRHPEKLPHPVYAAQSLFSIYVHTRRNFSNYPPTSIFWGREIVPQTDSERFKHSLALVSLLLLEAAFYDTSVRNVHFVILSAADVPLYNGGMLWLQLINEKRSRLGESHTFKELLQHDHV